MEWINLNESLPAFDTPVLVTGEGRTCIARLTETRVVSTASGTTTHCEFYESDTGYEHLWITPTHWTPIPLPIQPSK